MLKNNIIKFLLGNSLVIIDFEKDNYTPTTTVLNYLRSLPEYIGTKEGCAEGDCGACTVVIAEVVNNKLVYNSFDSCLLFLPSLHGKQIITIEHLGSSENLHVVQKDMIETHASQCGFCTPGFAMSIFALYKSENNTDIEEIKNSLAGNLCRCTGYRPIIDSAVKSCSIKKIDHFTSKEKDVVKILNEINSDLNYPAINNGVQSYYIPNNIEDLLNLKLAYNNAIIVNGSTDIALRVTKKRELLKTIIDLSLVSELKEVEITKNEVVFGSGVTLENVRKTIKDSHSELYKILSVFGSRQIRNKATIGGNIGSSSPIGDTIPVLIAYNSRLILKNKSKEREILLKDFIIDYRKNILLEDEIIYKIIIPSKRENTIIKSYKVSKRKDLDISTVSCSISLVLENNIVKEISIIYGGMAAYPKSAENVQKNLINSKWTKDNVLQALEFITDDYSPISDARSSDFGRLIMAKNLLLKFYNDTLS